MFPYLCLAWSMIFNLTYWNIKYPDGYSTYQATFFTFDTPSDSLLVTYHLPYCRYYSFQVYDHNFKPLDGILDFNIHTNGTNCFSTPCSNNLQQGESTIIVSINPAHEQWNNMIAVNSMGLYSIVLRLYDRIDSSNYFGGIDPPTVFKNNELIPFAPTQWYVDTTTPNAHDPEMIQVNQELVNIDNNFYKEQTYNTANNEDSDYLISLMEYSKTSKYHGAMIYGTLPITANSLYDSPRVGYISPHTNFIDPFHDDYYEIRYVSFSMVVRSFPGNTLSNYGYPTIMDKDILQHYGYNATDKWIKRHYTIYIGDTKETIEQMGGNTTTDLYLLYPRDRNGTIYKYLGIIYRNVLSQTKILGDTAIYTQSISDIHDEVAYSKDCMEVMGEYYPRIKFL